MLVREMGRRALAVAVIVLGLAPAATGEAAPADRPANAGVSTGTAVVEPGCSSVPFHRNEFGYSYFRVPAVVGTADGVLLAFAEGRVTGGGDSGDIDLVLR